MGKTTVAHGEFLFAGLNSFEPGQEHASHAHEGEDQLYVVLEGSCLVQVGVQEERLSVGDAAFALSGVLHSIRNPGPSAWWCWRYWLLPRASSHPRRRSEALRINTR
jgi:quercetin dioxygenase-like cupin family protein